MGLSLFERIMEFFDRETIRVYGIASTSLLDEAPAGFHPKDYLAGVKSFICFAVPVPLGVYSLGTYREEFVWRSQNLVYRQLDTASIGLANILESEGHKALPLFGCLPQRYNTKKEIAGYLNQIAMGSAAGIGFLGKNGLLVNELYGPRMMLGAVITDAALPASAEPKSFKGDCPPDCRICSDICPVGAVLPDERRVKVMKCLYYTADARSLPKARFFLQRIFKPEASIKLLNLTSFDEHTFHKCSLCVSECPYGK
jgi:epoxyqueuosine reductase